ncbi:hypothetical protein [Janibacter alkaliphilus]|nr:hypothetical protein [Janibacter alkaliphilus]
MSVHRQGRGAARVEARRRLTGEDRRFARQLRRRRRGRWWLAAR